MSHGINVILFDSCGIPMICGSAYIKDGKLCIQFYCAESKAHTHVFVWDLAKTNTSQPSYGGPFKNSEETPKIF